MHHKNTDVFITGISFAAVINTISDNNNTPIRLRLGITYLGVLRVK